MAGALDISAVVALGIAADKFTRLGRFAAAAEKWELAVEAARALGAPDCLVVVDAQARLLRYIAPLAHKPSLISVDADSLRAQMFQSFSACCAAQQLEPPDEAQALQSLGRKTPLSVVIQVLERRRTAGTLLYGKCAPHEVQWARQLALIYEPDPRNTTMDEWVRLIGYEVYLKAARLALYLLQHPCEDVLPTAEQKAQAFIFVQSALNLMCAPRPIENITSNAEAMLLDNLRDILSTATSGQGLSRSYRVALQAALDRLEASGIVARRQMEGILQNTKARFRVFTATAQAESAARGLQSCAHCGAAEQHVSHFKRCSACKAVVFCGKECQLANWPAHKAACKAARKAAAGAAAGA